MRCAIRTNCAGCWTCRTEIAQAARTSAGTVSAVRAARICGPDAAGRPGRSAAATGAAVGRRDAEVPGFVADPVGDAAATRQPGLLQKYQAACCSITTGTCAVHCRYCFRRNFPYDESPRSLDDWRPALDEIAADDSIHEVILSGGDPLTLVDATLAALIEQLADIPHVRRLRIHTRLPIVIPERVTDALIDLLRGSRLTPIVVVHANHANELDEHVAAALANWPMRASCC